MSQGEFMLGDSGSHQEPIATAGKLFPDGTSLHLIEDPSQPNGLALLRWQDHKTSESSLFLQDGNAYVPLIPPAAIRGALTLPTWPSPHESHGKLFDNLVLAARKFTGLPDSSAELLIGIVESSWLTEWARLPYVISLYSPFPEDSAQVLRFLKCVCRHALMLCGPTIRDLSTLPDGFQYTVLMLRPPTNQRTLDVFATSGWPDFYSSRGGRWVEALGVKIFSTDAPLRGRGLRPIFEIPIPRIGQSVPPLDLRAQRLLASQFQGPLLQFRSEWHTTGCGRRVDDRSADGMDPVSNALRACFRSEPNTGDRLMLLLPTSGQDRDAANQSDLRILLMEVLLFFCHKSGVSQIHVEEIAEEIAHLLTSRGGLLDPPTSRMVGALLKSVGLRTRRLGRTGRGLKLDRAIRKLIHRLVRQYGVASTGQGFADCSECAQFQATEK